MAAVRFQRRAGMAKGIDVLLQYTFWGSESSGECKKRTHSLNSQETNQLFL